MNRDLTHADPLVQAGAGGRGAGERGPTAEAGSGQLDRPVHCAGAGSAATSSAVGPARI